jgi:ribosomal-protein-alanine N-acetyltransferase
VVIVAIDWPLSLSANGVILRPLKRSDRHHWAEIKFRNKSWLNPWEATSPDGMPVNPVFKDIYRLSKRAAKSRNTFMFAIEVDGHLVGQITLGNVIWGSLREAYIGYWIDETYANRGIMTTSLALLTDYALAEAGLHRIEVSIRPENAASLRVVEKLGFIKEGLRPRFLHIDGDWRDHFIFVLTSENINSSKIAQILR